MKVTICFHIRSWGYYLADQLYRRDALEYLYTAFFGGLGPKRNDQDIDIPREKVRTNLASAVLFYGYNPKNILFAERYFGNWVAKNVANEDIVVALAQTSLPIIKRARELGIISVVERGSSHVIFQRDILLEEFQRYGQPTQHLQDSFSQERIDQELLEYELADYISIPSSFVENTFLDLGVPKEKLVKNKYGVDLSEFHQLPKRDDMFRVVFAGGMTLRKGVQYLLQAFFELDLPNAELWLIGPKSPEIDPFFEKYAGAFRFLGYQPQAKLNELYSQCTVFALCSIEEGLARVQLQAMACGLPLICTTNTGGDDLIEDGKEGYVVPIRDVDALKDKISYLYEHPQLCYEMSRAAKRKVQNGYTWDDYGEKAYGIYEDMIRAKTNLE